MLLQLAESPFQYDSHVELIQLLRQQGDLDKARQARQNMSEVFPLTEGLFFAPIALSLSFSFLLLPYPTLPSLPFFPPSLPPSSPFSTPSPLLSPFLLPSFLLSPLLLPSFLLPPSPLLLKHFTGNYSVVAHSSPLELWMEWLGDELPLASLPEAIVELRVLFEKAIGDYLCT